MKLLISLIALTFCATAHADDNAVQATRVYSQVSFTMNSMQNPDETVYYSCDSLVDRTEAMLKNSGATDIKVNCAGDGGFVRPSFSPTVTATFASPHQSAPGQKGDQIVAHWQKVSMHDFQDCDTVHQVLMGVSSALELRNFAPKACGGGMNDSYRFEFDALFEK